MTRSILIPSLIWLSFLWMARTEAHDSRVYELRTYYAQEGKLDALLDRFGNHTCQIFQKHGIENIGYWVPEDNPDNVLVYIIAFPSRLDQESMWKAFLNDPEWKAAYRASTAKGKLVEKIDSLFLQATDYSMPIKRVQSEPERLFELRAYKAAKGRLHHLDARFRDHTIGLFSKHGMENLVYFHPLADQEGAGDTLIYVIAHKDKAARQASFAAFREDPDWRKARSNSEARAGGSLTVKGGVTSQLLRPTYFSPMK